jgi:hypothetical protein
MRDKIIGKMFMKNLEKAYVTLTEILNNLNGESESIQTTEYLYLMYIYS